MDNFVNKERINFREKLNSDKHDNILKSFTNKINDLKVEMEMTDELIEENKEIKEVNDIAVKTSLSRLQSEFDTLQAQMEELVLNSEYKRLFVYADQFDNAYSNGENKSYIDKESSSAILNFNKKNNKLMVHDEVYNQNFIPKDTNIFIDYEIDGEFEVVKLSEINNIILPNKTFFSKIKTQRSVSEVIMNVSFVLPKDIINNNDLNAIIMEAFPYNSVDIISIEYNDIGEKKSFKVLENHPKSKSDVINDYSYNIIENSKKEIFNFPQVKTAEVFIKIRQRNYKDVLNDRFFYIGFESLELVNLNFENDSSVFYSIVEFNTPGEKTIHNIKPIINNPNYTNLEDISIDVSYLDALNNPVPIKENFPLKISNNKFLIKCTLYKSATTPNITGFDIKYSTE